MFVTRKKYQAQSRRLEWVINHDPRFCKGIFKGKVKKSVTWDKGGCRYISRGETFDEAINNAIYGKFEVFDVFDW